MRKFTKYLYASTVFLTSFLALAQDISPLKINEKITIDGKLGEDSWRKAPEFSDFKQLKAKKRHLPDPTSTSFKLLVDDNSIYLGVCCREPDMKNLKADANISRDGNVFLQDVIEIFFSPENKVSEYYQFALSAGNVQWEQFYIENGTTTIGKYSSLWESAVYKGENFWSAEIRIPFAALYHTPAGDWKNKWLFNIARERNCGNRDEKTSFSPLSASFHESSKFRIIKNIPQKSFSLDIFPKSMALKVKAMKNNKYVSDILLEIEADNSAIGSYSIDLTEGNTDLIENYKITLKKGLNSVKISDLKLDAGIEKHELLLTIKKGGEMVLGSYFSAVLKYEKISFLFEEPFYRQCFYPDQKHDEIKGKINLNIDNDILSKSRVTISLDGAGLSEKMEINSPKAGELLFLFNAEKMLNGITTLKVEVISGNKSICEASTEVRKLETPSCTYAYLDKNLRFILNGKPIFPLGWRCSRYMVSQEFIDKYPYPHDKCSAVNFDEKNNVVNMEPERLLPEEKSEFVKDIRPSEKMFKCVSEKIEANRGNDKFWFYEFCGEPECRHVSPVYLKYIYEHIRKLDPYHPVVLASRAPDVYINCADIFRPHPYLDPSVDEKGKRSMKSPKFISTRCLAVLNAGQRKKGLFMTPGVFSYSYLNTYSVSPTFREAQCMFWTGIVNGVKGFYTYCYPGSLETYELRLGSDFIYTSIDALKDILLSKKPALPVKVISPGDGVDVMFIKDGEKAFIVAVNLLNGDVSATIESDELSPYKQLYGFRSPKVYSPENNKLSLKFQPYEVKIMTFPKMEEGMETIEKLEEKIAALEKGRKVPGNLLWNKSKNIDYISDSKPDLKMKAFMTDGMKDVLAWKQMSKLSSEPYIEMIFLEDEPYFSKIKLYGNALEGVTIYDWEQGKYNRLTPARTKTEKYMTEMEFEKPVSPVKLKIAFPKKVKKDRELYEIEMFK